MPARSSPSAPSLRRIERALVLAALGWLAFSGAGAEAQIQGDAPTQAQTDDLGPAVAGGTGMRGTNDAADGLTGGDADVGLRATDGATPAKPVPRSKLALPKLTNRALPDRYPVPLVALKPYPLSLKRRLADPDEAPPSTAVAALPVLPRRTIRADEEPFAPLGYGVGSLRLVPYVEQSFGYDSNPEQISRGVKGSAFSRTEGGLAVLSNWSSHELKGSMEAGYNDFFSNPQANRPDANGVFDLRVDATRTTTLDAETRFNVSTQRPDSPELNVNVRDRPIIATFGGTLGATQAFGRFSVGLHALADRTVYDDGELSDGTPVNLSYQDVNDYGVKARLAYDLKPGLQPFVEFGYDRRVHDQTVDPFGFRRDSDGIAGRVGSSFEFWPQLTGTASVGYGLRSYDDPRLKDLTGPTAAASLAWAATPLTTLTLQANTAFNETTVIGASGIDSRVVGVSLSHALFRYLTVTAAVAYERDDYVGAPITENTLTASLKADYHLSRSFVLTGTLSRQQLSSTISGTDYTQNIAMLGLRLQH